MESPLWAHGALVAIWFRTPVLTHAARLHIDETTWSVRPLCGIGAGQYTSEPVSRWEGELPPVAGEQRRRCKKCVTRYDKLFLSWIENGCQVPLDDWGRVWAT